MRSLTRKIHVAAAFASFLFIAGFWTSSVFSELLLPDSCVATVKQAIVYALFIFIPTMTAAGGTGFFLGGRSTHALVAAKRRRMPVIALTGLLILVPAALFLNMKAQAGEFDAAFFLVQALELFAGASNLTLMGMNIRDGLRLSRNRNSHEISDALADS